jgi:hypothetical protein
MLAVMEISLKLTLDIDPETWQQLYRTHPDDLEQDVKHYVAYQVTRSKAATTGAILAVRCLARYAS